MRRERVRENTSTRPNILDIGTPHADGTCVRHIPHVKRLRNVPRAIQYLGSWRTISHLIENQQVNLMGSSKIFGQGAQELRWEFRPNFLPELCVWYHYRPGMPTLYHLGRAQPMHPGASCATFRAPYFAPITTVASFLCSSNSSFDTKKPTNMY